MMRIGSNEKTSNSSEQPILVLDLIRAILERLSLVDFHRARCVSSEWYYASKSCIRGGTNPWLIFFPKEHLHHHNKYKNESCKLFDPLNKKSYIVRDLGFNVAKSRCLASCGSWFLMLEHGTNIRLVNLFTRERIPLPSLESINESQIIVMKLYAYLHYKDKDKYKHKACRESPYGFSTIKIRKAVLWVDEKSRDYLVVWNHDNFVAYHKRDEKSWKVFEPFKYSGCVDMVFKESKLYVLRKNGVVTVFDFSGGHDSPVECASFIPSPMSLDYFDKDYYNLVVTLSGEVLLISYRIRYLFTIYKMDSKSSKWKIIESLGDDETLLLDLGITVAAKGVVVKNCIYYGKTEDSFQGFKDRINWWNGYDKYICVYNIKTKKVFKMFKHLTGSPSMHFKDARWFIPTFGGN